MAEFSGWNSVEKKIPIDMMNTADCTPRWIRAFFLATLATILSSRPGGALTLAERARAESRMLSSRSTDLIASIVLPQDGLKFLAEQLSSPVNPRADRCFGNVQDSGNFAVAHFLDGGQHQRMAQRRR